jgi:hypothetical protein
MAMCMVLLVGCSVTFKKEDKEIKKLMYQNHEFQVKQTGNVIILPNNQKLFVLVEDSPSMTQIMEDHWKKQGYTLVDKKEMADIAIEYGGFVQEERYVKKDGFSISYGQALEGVLSKMSTADRNNIQISMNTTFGAAGWLAVGQLNKIGLIGLGSGFSNFASFNAIDSLLKATGISDSINRALTSGKDVEQTVDVYALVEFPRTNNKKDMLCINYFHTWANPKEPQWGNLFSLAAEALPKMVVPQTIQQQ